MSGLIEESYGPPCLHNVPGHHPSIAQVADAARHSHRLVDAIAVEGQHTLIMTLDSGERVVARNHVTGELAEVWPVRAGIVSWNPTARLLTVPVREPFEGFACYHLTEGSYTPCRELEGSAEAEAAVGFDELVDAALSDLRTVDAGVEVDSGVEVDA